MSAVIVILVIGWIIPIVVFVARNMNRGNKVIRWYNSRNSGTDKMLDNMLNLCLDSTIKRVSFDEREICDGVCEFNNGWVYYYWNRNIPYAWLNKGRFERNGVTIYKYKNGMPSKRTMNRFYGMLFEYYKKDVC